MRFYYDVFRAASRLLYHPFAWTYDFVAQIVSLGRWVDWVHSTLPYLDGRILEIGFGPGHLQLSLLQKTPSVFGLDESRQMTRQTNHFLRAKGVSPKLSRGCAQHLPFPENVFDTVVCTFPSEYIFDPQTLSEAHRVLASNGNLVILPMAWVTGARPLEKLAQRLSRLAGFPPGQSQVISTAMKSKIEQAGFKTRSELVQLKGSQVLVIVARRISPHEQP